MPLTESGEPTRLYGPADISTHPSTLKVMRRFAQLLEAGVRPARRRARNMAPGSIGGAMSSTPVVRMILDLRTRAMDTPDAALR